MWNFFKTVFLMLIFCCTGCGAFVAFELIDKMVKIEKERRDALRQQVASIEGEIAKTEMTEKEVEEHVTSIKSLNGKDKIVTEKNTTIKKVYIVYFVDGREKIISIPYKPLLVGKYYIITYNGLNEIINIEEKKPE